MFNYNSMSEMKSLFTHKLPLVAMAIAVLFACDSKRTKKNTEPEIKELDHLIIEEVYYAGSAHAKGYMYKSDAYLKITNPTKEVKYLDKLALAVSTFSSNSLLELGKDVDHTMTHLGAARIMQFPGDGKTYPIQPGKSVIVANAAVNHKISPKDEDGDDKRFFNSASIDLTGANFEWLTDEQLGDDDFELNEKAINLLPIYSAASRANEDDQWEANDARAFGITSGVVALIKLGASVEELKKPEYLWKYYANNSAGGHAHAKSGKCLKVPNTWIIDAVNICPKQEFKWYIIGRDIDAGYASVRLASESDAQLSGKAIVRRHDGRNFVDTNNSTQDFEVKTASLFGQK